MTGRGRNFSNSSVTPTAPEPGPEDPCGLLNVLYLRKDKRLNGGEKYEIKNPGSRAGSGDDMLKALKALRSTLTDDDAIASIDEAIDNRIAELSVVKKVTIDPESLPEHLRHLIQK